MVDLLVIVAIVAFFAAALLSVRGCERIAGRPDRVIANGHGTASAGDDAVVDAGEVEQPGRLETTTARRAPLP